MRREDNFQELVKKKKIVIPIIQRDYAQGRNNPKAIIVRTRLIDEWIDILQNPNLRMDFNYIYGNETKDVFYPVDGQQRLTSLYLLHWYLAMATDNTEQIAKWQFDYKTRNSASEFFDFLRNEKKSKGLFVILHSNKDEDDKQTAIRNESWFKSKWENDPTVVSCINFLSLLSNKLSKYEKQFESFWNSLNDTSCPAVYFTCLNECDDKYAEIDAAKKYTRMNARGKKLTDFENLKAMIDEIEMKYIAELVYCTESANDEVDELGVFPKTISWTYDRVYIDCMFNSMKENTLIEKTKVISNESEKWFRLVYYVYALINKRDIPKDFRFLPFHSAECYEDVIYKISQERITDDKIPNYLYMLKAVFEVICNSADKLAFRYKEFNLDNYESRRQAIAFVLFVAGIWKVDNEKVNNAELIDKWIQFCSALNDLSFIQWKVQDDYEYALIIKKMVDDIHNVALDDINKYFVMNDFGTNSPFSSYEVLDDIKCRLLERKVKSKLLFDNVITEQELDKFTIGNKRWGYLYYLCDFLMDWKLEDWSNIEKWNKLDIKPYLELMEDANNFKCMMNTWEAKVVFAYASQYDIAKNSLFSGNDIDACNNEHIWNDDFLQWNDEEYNGIAQEKVKLLNHLKVMFSLLISYKSNHSVCNDDLLVEYVKKINMFFENTNGYEKCWLRFAAKYPVGGEDLLKSELENDSGIVKLRSVPVIIRSYLVQNEYSYIEKISRMKELHRKCNFFRADEKKIQYAFTDKTCTFEPDFDNTGKYQHSQKTLWGWDLSGNVIKRNMDLFYRAYFDLSGIGIPLKNNFWSIEIENGSYTIKIYEIGDIDAGKLSIRISEATLDDNFITLIESNVSQWKTRFDNVEKEPFRTGNYDHWIELWNNDYQTAFGSSFVQGKVTYDKSGGQRPRKQWSEVLTVPALNWNVKSENI